MYAGPWCLKPTPMKITHTSRARNIGTAIRAVAGMYRIGMMPGRLHR
jgi:hypothetical protein